MTKEPTGKAAAEKTAAASGTGTTAEAGERQSTDGSTSTSSTRTRRRGNRRAVSPGPGGPAGLLPVVAKEDDPRAWGDSTEDSESWLREQRPPHWG